MKDTLLLRTGGLLLLACLALFTVRVGSIWKSWAQMDERIAEQVAFFSILPEGARVYPVFPSPDLVHLSKEERSLDHVISLGITMRHAYVFSQFANPAQQPVLFRTAPVYAPLVGQVASLRGGRGIRVVLWAPHVCGVHLSEQMRAA